MKSITFRLALILLLLSVVGTTVQAQDEPPQPVLGALNIIVPELYMTPDGGTEGRLIAPTTFEAGETLRSDANGVGLLTWFYDGTESVIGPNSTLKLNGFSGDEDGEFLIDLELTAGHLVNGMGNVADAIEQGTWTVTTPAFTVKMLRGQFDVTVAEDGTTTLIVIDGRVEVTVEGSDPITIDEGQYLVSGGEPTTFTDDGVTVNLPVMCTVTANTNLNVRLAPNEDSRKLGGVSEGQVFWVHASTEGDLWLQVFYRTPEDDEEGHNVGWIYGPAGTLDAANCGQILRAPLDAMLFGGEGIDEPVGAEGESEPLSQ